MKIILFGNLYGLKKNEKIDTNDEAIKYYEKAIEYYKQALEIDPEMTNARMNIVVAILAKERAIIDEMNGLGMSKEDNKRYEELEEERKEIYEQAVPYLEKVIESDPENENDYKKVGWSSHYEFAKFVRGAPAFL